MYIGSILKRTLPRVGILMKQLILAVFILGVLGAIALPIRCHAEENTLVMVADLEGKGSFQERFCVMIYTEALHRLGYRLELQRYPSARASLLLDKGEVDGDLGRIYDYGETHPNLIRVEEANSSLVFTAFAVKPGIRLEGWESLRDTTYKVEYRLGGKRPGIVLPQLVDSDHLSSIPKMEQGLKKLLLGRTDVYIDVGSITLEAIRELERSQPRAAAIYEAGIMESFTSHAFLHKKNAALALRLSETLKTMKNEGLFELYRKKVQ